MKKIHMFVNVDWFFFSHRLPIASAALDNNIEMEVFAEFTSRQSYPDIKGFKFLRSPLRRTSKSVVHALFEFIKTYNLIKQESPDLIHAVTIKPIIVLGLVSRITSTPFIGAIAGLGPAFNSKTIIQRLRLRALEKILKFIFSGKKAIIVCQNQHDKSLLINKKITSSNKIFIIPGSGVDLEVYSPSRKRRNVAKYILMSSRMLLDKGVKEYCLAAKIVNERLNNKIEFKLSGPIDIDSPSFISESEIIEITSSCGVEYIGNRFDMPELLASATIFVLPSYYPEGIPKVLLEAAACGVPVITTDHPGCRDAVINNKTGLIVPAKNIHILADTIIKLLSDEKSLNEKRIQAREHAETNFADSIIVKKHFLLYEKLLETFECY